MNTRHQFAFALTALALATTSASAAAVTTTASNVPTGYTYCSGEGQICKFSGKQVIAFGANGNFRYGTYSNSVVCATPNLGGVDPAPHYLKTCSYAPVATTTTSTTTAATTTSTSTSISTKAATTATVAPAVTTAATTTTVATATTSAGALKYEGVHLAGADFSADANGNGVFPGTYGANWKYPTADETAYFLGKGMNIVRMGFRWERLQTTLYTDFDATELGRMDTFVNASTALGMTVLIDPHNFGHWHTNLVGSAAVPNAAFADFWGRLADHFKSNPRVIFGLMNEPQGGTTEAWLSAANAAIAAIRNTGATQLILVPGNGWTASAGWNQTWYGTANSVAMLGVVDPLANYAYEVHTYLDTNSAGNSDQCLSTTIGVERVSTFTSWLRANGKKAFLGEFAGGNNATCNAAVQNLLGYLKSNSDVWMGWSWWAAGPMWGEYRYTLEPLNGVDRPQMAWLTPYL